MVTTFAEAPRQAVKTAPSKPVLTVAPPQEERKVAVITGAGRGLGKAVAFALANEGYALALCDRTGQGKKVADDLMKMDYVAVYEHVDVVFYKRLASFLQDTEKRWGRIDVLVNNAGFVHEKKSVETISHADFDPCFETNAIAPMTAIQAVLPGMVRRESGCIINVASKAARYASPGFAAYNMSKAALVSLTQTVAKELKGTGVRIYSVSPGGMNTEMRDKAHGDAKEQMDPADVAFHIARLAKGERIGGKAYWIPDGADVIVSKKGIEVHPMEEWYE